MPGEGRHAACEPHVVELCEFLRKLGAGVSGAGSNAGSAGAGAGGGVWIGAGSGAPPSHGATLRGCDGGGATGASGPMGVTGAGGGVETYAAGGVKLSWGRCTGRFE